MTFYAVGSLLIAFGAVAALAVIMGNFHHYRGKMMRALRALSLDGIYPPSAIAQTLYGPTPAPAVKALPARQARRLAA